MKALKCIGSQVLRVITGAAVLGALYLLVGAVVLLAGPHGELAHAFACGFALAAACVPCWLIGHALD